MLLLTLSMSSAAYANSAAKTSTAPALPTTVGIGISCADAYENCGSQSDSSGLFNVPFTEPAAIVAYGVYEAGTTSVVTFQAISACGDQSLDDLGFQTICESTPSPTGAYFVATGISLKWVHNPYPGELGTTQAKWVLQVKLVGLDEVYLGGVTIFEGAGSITVLCQQIATSGIAHFPQAWQGPAFYGQQDVVGQTNGGVLSNSFTAEVGCSASIP